MIRLVFELCLKNHPDIHLVAAWSSGSELFSALSTHSVDVLILDFLLGEREIDGLAKFRRSRKTVSGQKQSALKKLGVRSDSELFKYSRELLSAR